MSKKLTLAFIVLVYTLAHLYALLNEVAVGLDIKTFLLPFILMGMYPPFLPMLEMMGLTVVTLGTVYPTLMGAGLVAVVSILLVYIASLIIFKN